MEIDIEKKKTILLNQNEGVLVPKNISHRPRASKGAVVIMIESKTINPRGVQL